MKLDFESNTSTFISIGNDYTERTETDNKQIEVSKMLREGIEAAQSGKSGEARNLLLRVTEIEPTNEKAWLWLASISEYPEELLVFLNNVLKINPENERALEWAKATKTLLSKTFVQRGIDAANEQGDFAKQCFMQAIGHDEGNEMAWLWLASVSTSEEEKSEHLQKVLNINPENETAKNLLGSMQKNKCDAMFQKAMSFAVEGENAQALEVLEEYFAASTEKENALVLKSFLVGSFAEKLECFESILEVNQENDLAQRNAAYLRTMMQKPELEASAPEVFAAEETAVEMPQEVVAETAAERVFASEEYNFVEEAQEENPMPELEVPQFEVVQEEEFSLANESEIEAEYAEMENRFEDLQQMPAAEMQAAEEEETEVQEENAEMSADYSDESVNEEKTYAFYEHQKEIVDHFAPQSVSANVEENPVADYNRETESFENVQELTQAYDFAQTEEVKEEMNEAAPESEASDIYEMQASETIAENNYSSFDESAENSSPQPEAELAETMMNFNAAETEVEEKLEESEATTYYTEENSLESKVEMVACGFCEASNDANSLVCYSCRAILTLSDLEMILANQESDKEMIGNAIFQMEAERENRELNSDELKQIALGYLNIGNLPKGLSYLNEAVKMNPDDFVLSGQINSLKIRHSEIEKQKDAQEGMPKNLTILVVDDSATVRKLISGKLEKTGHAVVSAIDGVDALEKIKDMVPDLVLLDINMPRMDGYQVCKMIRSNDATKDVPVVMISGKDGFFDKVRGRMAGTTGYITKPFGPETLMKTVETYIV